MKDQPTSQSEPDDDADDPSGAAAPEVIPAEHIFGDKREVWIEFNGERYRLRITRRGKLILQK